MVAMTCTGEYRGSLTSGWAWRSWISVGLACLIYVSCVSAAANVVSSKDLDAYEQLEKYGFPSGLLPHIVTGYDLSDDGTFVLYLANKCEVDIPSAYPVVYNERITGRLTDKNLSNLTGVQVKISFIWFTITSIKVKNDYALTFSIGLFSEDYPIHPNFDEDPICVGSLSQGRPFLAQ